jgi:hypothetical protein
MSNDVPIELRTFAEAGSSDEAHRAFALVTARVRRYRRNKRLGLRLRTVRLSQPQADKLIELGYLSRSNDGGAMAEGIAIEAYLADNLS